MSTEELVLSQDSSDIRFLIEGAFGVPMKAVEQTLEQCQLLNLKSHLKNQKRPYPHYFVKSLKMFMKVQ